MFKTRKIIAMLLALVFAVSICAAAAAEEIPDTAAVEETPADVEAPPETVVADVPAVEEETLTTFADPDAEASFDVLRTAINPGYYFSGALIDMGKTLNAGDVDKDTFSAKAKVTEADGSVQGSFGNFAWDPDKTDYALGENWAKWNILDAYVADADGNRTASGEYVKLDIEWGTRTIPSGASSAERYDVPATRASWYTISGYHALASVELEIEQNKEIPGVSITTYAQNETRHDPLFAAFDLSLTVPGGGKAPLYTPGNASADNLRPLLVWFHGTGERFAEITVEGSAVNNPGGNLVGNRALAFAGEEFQTALGGAYVLAPQSTTAGWNAGRLGDMETLIKQVISENHIDPKRIFVGGLSMGTGMVTPLITSVTESSINFAAAMLVSGGNLDAAQAQVVSDKGFPVYLVGNTSDFASASQPATYDRLIAAGVDAKLMRYPEGPVFDGDYYYGAHDSWNYVYNNLVKDEDGVTIYEWMSGLPLQNAVSLSVAPNTVLLATEKTIAAKMTVKNLVGGANVISGILNVSDPRFTLSVSAAYPGASVVRNETDGLFRLFKTGVFEDADFADLLHIRLTLKDGATLKSGDTVSAILDSIVFTFGENTLPSAIKKGTATTAVWIKSGVVGDVEGDGKVDAKDLSYALTLFGKRVGDADWYSSSAFIADYNDDGIVDMEDITAIAYLSIGLAV